VTRDAARNGTCDVVVGAGGLTLALDRERRQLVNGVAELEADAPVERGRRSSSGRAPRRSRDGS
jgi:hypothetical protein